MSRDRRGDGVKVVSGYLQTSPDSSSAAWMFRFDLSVMRLAIRSQQSGLQPEFSILSALQGGRILRNSCGSDRGLVELGAVGWNTTRWLSSLHSAVS
jgi:hypothetical protein